MSNLVPLAIVTVSIVLLSYWSGDQFDPSSIAGKRVLVTGASSGIGEQLAYHYCKLGARVVITARRQQRLERVTSKCRDLGAQQVEFVPADLGQAKDRIAVIQKVRKELGGLDHLVLNHGVASMAYWRGSEQNMNDFLRQLDINFVSFVDLASQSLDMLTESRGHIGVVSSVTGKIAFPMFASYTSTKFALQGFFRALDLEQQIRGTGVSVTLCVIGLVDTEMVRSTVTEEQFMKITDNFLLKWVATAEDTAEAILHGVATRQPEIYYGRNAAVLTYLHRICPSLAESFGKIHTYGLK